MSQVESITEHHFFFVPSYHLFVFALKRRMQTSTGRSHNPRWREWHGSSSAQLAKTCVFEMGQQKKQRLRTTFPFPEPIRLDLHQFKISAVKAWETQVGTLECCTGCQWAKQCQAWDLVPEKGPKNDVPVRLPYAKTTLCTYSHDFLQRAEGIFFHWWILTAFVGFNEFRKCFWHGKDQTFCERV